MIKKISIISILTIAILYGSFAIQQRKSEAAFPLVGYVLISALVHFAVGAYVYFNDKDTGKLEMKKVGSINSNTGQIDFDVVFDEGGNEISEIQTGTTGANPINIYLHETVPSNYTSNPSTQRVYYSDTTVIGDRQNNIDACINSSDSSIDFCTQRIWHPTGNPIHYIVEGWNVNSGFLDPMVAEFPPLDYDVNAGTVGGAYTGSINGTSVEIYDVFADVPNLPNCFDGIQNQDETGVDCGGVCETNFGFVCPPIPETCNDNIMNQDETGIDYGGVCGTGDPVAEAAGNFTDTNQDGVDDFSGLDSGGSITVSTPASADSSTYDTTLPGDISDVGETDWSGLITGYLAVNPLVLLATGSSINLSGEDCTLTANVFGTDIVIDFCSVQGLVDLIGTFVLGLMAIRSVFIAMGI